MITANEPIQTTDPTSGLARRRLTIPFNNPFRGNSKEQKVLIDMDDRGNAFGVFCTNAAWFGELVIRYVS